MANIYIITSGSYSDYSINAVFSTREAAKKALASGFVYGGIEEYELDPVITSYPLLDQGWRMWDVEFDRKGNIQKTQEQTKEFSYTQLNEMEGGYYWSICSYRNVICVSLLARDNEHAIKSANEKRAMVMSNPKLWNPEYYHNNENFQVRHFEDTTKW